MKVGIICLYTFSGTRNELVLPDMELRSTSRNHYNMSRCSHFGSAPLCNRSHIALCPGNSRQDPAMVIRYAAAQTTWPFVYAETIPCYLATACRPHLIFAKGAVRRWQEEHVNTGRDAYAAKLQLHKFTQIAHSLKHHQPCKLVEAGTLPVIARSRGTNGINPVALRPA